MGTLFGLQRRATGGIQAPLITHVVWSALMLRFLPPLFPPQHVPPQQVPPQPADSIVDDDRVVSDRGG
jgi:hypothetical protein